MTCGGIDDCMYHRSEYLGFSCLVCGWKAIIFDYYSDRYLYFLYFPKLKRAPSSVTVCNISKKLF